VDGTACNIFDILLVAVHGAVDEASKSELHVGVFLTLFGEYLDALIVRDFMEIVVGDLFPVKHNRRGARLSRDRCHGHFLRRRLHEPIHGGMQWQNGCQ